MRFHDTADFGQLSITFDALYSASDGVSSETTAGEIECVLSGPSGNCLVEASVPLTEPSVVLDIPKDLEPGDYTLLVQGVVAGKRIEMGRAVISWVPNRSARVRAIEEIIQNEPSGLLLPNSKATLEFGLATLERAFQKQDLEMDYPAHRVLSQLEQVAQRAHAPHWLQPDGDGQWLSLRGKTKGQAFLRVMAPPQKQPKPRPCVIALHGAGGSENLFFDGYGAGKIVELCRKRGWVLIAPRASFVGAGIPFVDLLDALSEPLSIDRDRVFLVGHSMGVAACFSALRQAKNGDGTTYRAVAAIAGGNRQRSAPASTQTRFMTVTGSDDFARKGVLRLHKSLVDLGLGSRLVEMDKVEHMAIVQFALPQVFDFFDERVKE